MVGKDWLPGRREDQLEMAESWLVVMKIKGKLAWKMDDDLIADFEEAIARAREELFRPKKTRTAGTNVQLREAFENLVAKMRYIKNNYLVPSVMTDEDRVNMKLRPKDVVHTPVPAPTGLAKADVSYPGGEQVMLRIKHMEGTPFDERAEDGFRIYYGVYAHGETPPATGKDLRTSQYSHHKKLIIRFEPEDRGKMAYFCIRYENGKGENGPWGPMFSAVIT